MRSAQTFGQRQVHFVPPLQFAHLQFVQLCVVFEQNAQVHLDHAGFEHRQLLGFEIFIRKSLHNVGVQRTELAGFGTARQRLEITRRGRAAVVADHALIHGLCRRVEDRSEQIGLDAVVGSGLRHAVVAHIFVVEAQGAAQIRVDGRRRKRGVRALHAAFRIATVETLHKVARFVDGGGRVQQRIEVNAQSQVDNRQISVDPQLRHEARHLAGGESFGRTVERHAQTPRPLHETVEVVSINRRAAFGSGEAESFAQHVRNERVVVGRLRQRTFVDRKQQHVVKIQTARLEHAEHLQPHGGFAVKRHRGLPNDLAHHTTQGAHAHFQPARGRNDAQAVEQGGHEIEGLGLQHIFKPRGVEIRSPANVLGPLIYARTQAVEHLDGRQRNAAALQIGEALFHQRVGFGVPERETLGDVHLMHPFGKHAQHGLEQILVAQHHRRAPMRRFVGRQVFFEPSAHTLRLRGFARGRNHLDLLDVSEIVEALGR